MTAFGPTASLPTASVGFPAGLPPSPVFSVAGVELGDMPRQRWLVRTGHHDEWQQIVVDDLRITVKRGVSASAQEAVLQVRALRDNLRWSNWAKRSMGKVGDRTMTLLYGGFGCADDWQFEIACNEDVPISLLSVEILATPLGH